MELRTTGYRTVTDPCHINLWAADADTLNTWRAEERQYVVILDGSALSAHETPGRCRRWIESMGIESTATIEALADCTWSEPNTLSDYACLWALDAEWIESPNVEIYCEPIPGTGKERCDFGGAYQQAMAECRLLHAIFDATPVIRNIYFPAIDDESSHGPWEYEAGLTPVIETWSHRFGTRIN